MFHNLEKQIQTLVRERVREQFGVDAEIVLEQPKQASFGELALPVAFQLAKSLKQSPKRIAADVIAAVGTIPGVAALEIAGNGYINVRFDRGFYGAALLKMPDTHAATAG